MKDKPPFAQVELVKFLSMCVSITRFKFSYRRTLWRNEEISKHVPTFKIGDMIEITRNRYDDMLSCLR